MVVNGMVIPWEKEGFGHHSASTLGGFSGGPGIARTTKSGIELVHKPAKALISPYLFIKAKKFILQELKGGSSNIWMVSSKAIPPSIKPGDEGMLLSK